MFILLLIENHLKDCTSRRIGLNCNTAIMHSHDLTDQCKSQSYTAKLSASGLIHAKEWFKYTLPELFRDSTSCIRY